MSDRPRVPHPKTSPAGAPAIVDYYANFYDVLTTIFPRLEHLHYGIAAAPLAGLSRRTLADLSHGGARLLERLGVEADLEAFVRSRAGAAKGNNERGEARHDVSGGEPRRDARGIDLGCGVGGTTLHLAERFGLSMTGVNLNAQQLERARQRAAERGLTSRTRWCRANVCTLPLESASFDLAVMIEVAFHVADKPTLFAEAARVLEPGGLFLLVDQENRTALDVMGLFFFPERGTYARLAAEHGLELVREVDWSQELADWMQAYAHTARAGVSALVALKALWQGGPSLAARYLSGVRFYDRLIRADDAALDLGHARQSGGGIFALRRRTAAALRNEEAWYKLWVMRKR